MTSFGVKTTVQSNQILSNGYDLFHWVTRKRDVPAFWMRNLTGKNAVQADEVAFLKEKNCKVGFFLHDFSERAITSVDGTADAWRAIDAAIALKVPRYMGIAIFAVIPGDWNINHNWMMSFACHLCEKGYIPGFIGNTDSSKNFSFDRECGHFIHATGDVNHYCAVYGATEPGVKSMLNGWTPFAPSDLHPSQISLWCDNETIPFREIVSEPVYARSESVLSYFW